MKSLQLASAISLASLLMACTSGTDMAETTGNQAPVIVAQDEITTTVGLTTVMDASNSYDPEGQTLNLQWQLKQRPASSSATLSPQDTLAQLVSDVPGIYQVTIEASDGERTSKKTLNIFALQSSNTETESGNDDSNNTGNASGENTETETETENGNSNGMDQGQTESNQNCTVPTYSAGSTYTTNQVVTNNSSYYLCNVSGWCSSSAAFAYEPGVGYAWQDAWSSVTQQQACAAGQEETQEGGDNETVDNNTGNTDSGNTGSSGSGSDNGSTGSETGNSGSTDSGSGSGSSGSSNESAGNSEAWMDSVDASGWPQPLKNANVAYEQTTNKVVGTYFVEWGVYGRNYHVADIPSQNLTHILYGFIPVCGPNDSLQQANAQGYAALVEQCEGKQDYEVTIHDTYAALEKSYPGDSWDTPIKGNFGQLMRMKKAQPDLKILPSVGGWTLSDPLFDMASSANRTVFINSLIQFLKDYPFFDGIDIDWEFPGGGGANPSLGSTQDGPTYVTLMRELRSALDDLQSETGKYYEITSAIGTSPRFINAVDYGQATQYMDYLFMMNYDFKGSWSSELGHQTNMYPSTMTQDTTLSVETAVNLLLGQGVNSTKLVLGVAKYGRGWKNISGASEANPFDGQGGGAISGTWEAGILDYKDIETNYLGGADGTGINGWEYRWDTSASAPYLWHSANKQLISFDDARSTEIKARYAIDHNLGGVFSWEIDADSGTLLNAMNKGLGHAKK